MSLHSYAAMFANICSYQKQQWIPLISSCWRAGDSFQTVCDTETVRTWKKPRALWRAALQKSSSPTQSEAPRNRRRWTAEKPESFYSFSSVVLWRGCLATGMDSARYHRKELPRAVTAKTQPPHNQLCCLPYKLWSHSKISSWIIPYLYKTTDQFFTNSSHCPDHTLYSALWVCPFTCKWAKTTQRCLTRLCHIHDHFTTSVFTDLQAQARALKLPRLFSLLFFSPTCWEGKWWLMHFTFHLAALLTWEEEAGQAGAVSLPALHGASATATTATACTVATKSNILSH